MPLSSLRNSFRRKNKPEKMKVTENWLSENSQEKPIERKTSPHHIFSKVGDAKALWSNRFETYAAKQASNPFSDKYVGPAKIDKNDPNYGRPEANSMTAQRARDGEAKVRQEVCDLCDIIFNLGVTSSEGRSKIQFGELFQIYNGINDKVVGLLLRARKRHLLTFEGEMLFQRRDDDKWITLTKNINSIHVYFGRAPDIKDGGTVEYDDPQIASELQSQAAKDNIACEIRTSKDDEEIKSIHILPTDETQNDNINCKNSQSLKETEQNEIMKAECELKLQSGQDRPRPPSDLSTNEKRKPKLSFRFRKPSRLQSNKENGASSTSPTELSANQNPPERKKSVMAAIFGNLPMIPSQHVSTASVNLKKKTEGDVRPSSSGLVSVSRRISLRLKSRRKSEAPVQSKNINGPDEKSKTDNNPMIDHESEGESAIEVQKSKSFDDNIRLANCISDALEPEVTEDKTLSPEKPKEQESDSKINRKVSRRASMVAAAATARQKWEQMKNSAPAVNILSLTSKSKREGNKVTIDEKDTHTPPNVGENNNGLDVEKSKIDIVTTNESS